MPDVAVEETLFACGICSREFKKAGHLRMHLERAHQKDPETFEPDEVAPPPTQTEPVLVEPKPARLNLRRSNRLTPGGRYVKMLRPRCKECQREPNVPADWYNHCPHNPYMGLREVKTLVPRYSEPDEEGRRTVLGVDEKVHWETRPNLTQVAVSVRVNSGNAVERAQRKGNIFPEDLRCPEYPHGIAPFCEFRECMSQDIKYITPYGNFCDEMQAKLVQADFHGTVLEIGFDQKSAEKRRRQLAEIRV